MGTHRSLYIRRTDFVRDRPFIYWKNTYAHTYTHMQSANRRMAWGSLTPTAAMNQMLNSG